MARPDLQGRVPVIMCTWKRADLLERTLRSMEAQRGCSVHLLIWNNNPAIVPVVDRVTQAASVPVEVFHGNRNTGGFGRFYWARLVAPACKTVIFIDDDQIFDSTAIRTFIDEATANTLTSQWAFRFLSKDKYWLREQVGPGEPADYCGTGGMVGDASIFLNDELFSCPRRYWFIEDLWLSYFANHRLGWKLRGSRVQAATIDDEHQRYRWMVYRKSQFLRYLVNQEGWRLLLDAPSACDDSPRKDLGVGVRERDLE